MSARIFLCLVWLSLAAGPGGAWAEGLRNPPPGSFNLGRAGGRIAHVDDASAITQNPANLVSLDRPEAQFTPSVVYIHIAYDSPSGSSAETHSPWKALPNFFASTPLGDGQAALGLGITAPYGLGNVWDYDSGAFADPLGLRYASPYSAELKTVNFNPTFSLQMGERLRFGAGLDVMYSDLTFKQFYPWAAVTGQPADGEGKAQARGDGAGVGMNVGLTWEFIDRHRLAITYRSAIDVDYDGHFRVKDAPALFGGGTYSTSFRSHIQFPSILGLGYGVELTDTLRLEVDFEWLKFSNFQNLPIDIAQPLPGLPSNVPENWRDTFTVGFGGDWRFASNWVVRAGYQFYQSPVPDSTFSPSIPDANQNVITVGVGAQFGRHSFEAAYGYDFYDERRITNNQNPAFNGNYDITVHLISFAYRLRF